MGFIIIQMGFQLKFETVLSIGKFASWDIVFESCHLNFNNFNTSRVWWDLYYSLKNMCDATREGCFFTNNSCSLTKGVVNYHAISWCCFCEEAYSYCNTSSQEQLIVTSQRDVLEYANKIDAQKMRNCSPAIVKRL